MMCGSQDLSFKELLKLLEDEHERSLQVLRDERAQLRASFGHEEVAKTKLAGTWDILISEANTPKHGFDSKTPSANAGRAGGGVIPDTLRANTHQLWPTWTGALPLKKSLSSQCWSDLVAEMSDRTRKISRAGTANRSTHLLGGSWTKCSTLVMDPTSQKIMFWNILALLLLSFDLVWIPVRLAFDPSVGQGLNYLESMIILYWTVDMGMTFITGIYSADGTVIRKLKPISKQYFFGYFWLDVFIVGSDWLQLLMEVSPLGDLGLLRSGKLFRVLRLARSVRLMRLVKMQEIFYALLDRLSAESMVIVLDIGAKVLMVLAMNHIIACVWYWIGTGSDGWVNDSGASSTWEQYLISIHWALSAFTPAQKPLVRPRTLNERTFAVCMILAALVTMGTFLGGITAQMTRLRQLQTEPLHRSFKLRKFLRENRISADLSGRVTRFVAVAWKIHKKRLALDQIELIEYISGPLRVELLNEIYSPSLHHHPFFKMYHEWSSNAMGRLCYSAISREHYSRRDPIFSCGVDSEYMYFLHTGTLFYLRPKGVSWDTSRRATKASSNRVMVVHRGQWFCEATLWVPWVHQGSMGSMIESELIKLSASTFQYISKQQIEIFDRCRACASRFLENIEQTCRECGCMWDLPPETILSEIFDDDSEYFEDDPRLKEKQHLDADMRAAQVAQAYLDRMQVADSDSEDDVPMANSPAAKLD